MKAVSICSFLGRGMNASLLPFVRSTFVVAAVALALPCFSQGQKDGLTKDFSKLSAKERTKIAAQENQEAAVDTNYQSVMRAAESAFQAGDYDKALAHYQDARKMRPYNVYPKVKIQDLQALLKKRNEEKAAMPLAVVDTSIVEPQQAAPTKPADVSVAPIIEAAPIATEKPPVPAVTTVSPAAAAQPTPEPVPEKKPEPPQPASVVPARAPSIRAPEETSVPKTLGERVFLEGGAVVTERTVMDDDRPTVYRRVVHPSGQVFTFKDGLSIPERMWDERFGE